jgi:hypothetical protein
MMATILLSAAGAAVGAGFGGTMLGLSGAVIGRAVGASVGQAIDQRLLGSGSAPVEMGRIDRFRLNGAGEGAPIGRLWGRMRVPGQVIWATRFAQNETTARSGGKGAAKATTTTQFSYSVSLALAVSEGEITRIGRIWADGAEIAAETLNMRVYPGSQSQLPDPKIAAVEGSDMAPAYRGIAYVVIEDLDLAPYGNRVPQFSFEVVRAAQGTLIQDAPDLSRSLRAVALIPGTGEYALATTPVHFEHGLGENVSANVNTPLGGTDFAASIEALRQELPNCGSVSLIVSWFGDDLRCGMCSLRPKVENVQFDGVGMPWRVSGIGREQAQEIAQLNARPVYGGTPSDASILEAIERLKSAGQSVVFYPFILMEQLAGNGLPDPWTGAESQPSLPWRGRITLSVAPGRLGSPDGSFAASQEVAAFFGTATASDFAIVNGEVVYAGAQEWSLRRFILHYAMLCKLAGGVDAFCIGSELVSLNLIRGAENSFPAVAALRTLAADVRTILGADCKISYAADWSEYFGFHPGNGDIYFHLDPLWADANIDFVGIDNYLPLSDWRDGEAHADAAWGSIYNLDYLKANIEGGEGYEWYYAAPEHRDAQIRSPITDGAYDEPWVWRVKDLRNWWAHAHHERIDGVRQAGSTAWVPKSKPIWFTEIGCAAVDKGTNQPNKFLDMKSSESALPHYSDGRRDDLIQMQYLRAMMDYWGDAARNPLSSEYSGRMVDTTRATVWAWDARPFPYFPENANLWSDGENYARGHWISGRVTAQPLASVVAEICSAAGLVDIDVSGLFGLVRGYALSRGENGRSALQSLMLAYGFDAVDLFGKLVFRMREGRVLRLLGQDDLAQGEGALMMSTRAPSAEVAGRVRLGYVESEGSYEVRAVEAVFPDEKPAEAMQTELSLALTRSEGQRIVERWLAEARVARDSVKFALPPSLGFLGVGDVVEIDTMDAFGRYRIDRMEHLGHVEVEAVRVEPTIYVPSDEAEAEAVVRPFAAPLPVFPLFLDLPLISGQEVEHAPHLAVAAQPWPGAVAVYAASEDDGYELNKIITSRAVIGTTLNPLGPCKAGVFDRGNVLRIKLASGAFEAVSEDRLLNGANLLAIGDGSSENWELVQFARANLVEPDVWDISLLLRGQAGTDAIMPHVWPSGSLVVLVDSAPDQLDLPLSARGLARHYRIGSASRAYDDPSFVHRVEAFAGVGLRPYAPCHLRSAPLAGGTTVTWIRRSRIDGDSWMGMDVPLGETSEAYLVRVVQSGSVRRETISLGQSWQYTAAMRAADGLLGPYEIHVAQLSDAYGAGPFARILIDG